MSKYVSRETFPRFPERSGILHREPPFIPLAQQVRILNPASGHHGWTSFKKALKMVHRGTARLEGNAIRLIETDYRFNSEAVPRKAVVHAPNLPEVSTFEPCWLNSEAATSWRYQDTPGIPA